MKRKQLAKAAKRAFVGVAAVMIGHLDVDVSSSERLGILIFMIHTLAGYRAPFSDPYASRNDPPHGLPH